MDRYRCFMKASSLPKDFRRPSSRGRSCAPSSAQFRHDTRADVQSSEPNLEADEARSWALEAEPAMAERAGGGSRVAAYDRRQRETGPDGGAAEGRGLAAAVGWRGAWPICFPGRGGDPDQIMGAAARRSRASRRPCGSSWGIAPPAATIHLGPQHPVSQVGAFQDAGRTPRSDHRISPPASAISGRAPPPGCSRAPTPVDATRPPTWPSWARAPREQPCWISDPRPAGGTAQQRMARGLDLAR